jgi:hypothetical protein
MKAFLLKVLGGAGLLYILPRATFAQSYEAGKDSLQGYILLILQFINWVLIPFLFSLALLFFLINAARYFIIKGDNEGDREKARVLALYGIGAFVLLVSVWGIVNLFVFGLGIGRDEALCPDYMDNWCGSSSFREGYDYYGPGSEDYNYY